MNEVAVLFSGGLDSAVLLVHEARTAIVHPLYVSTGLAWEAEERLVATEILTLRALAGRVKPLVQLEFTMADLYPPTHWALTGSPPAYDTPDEDVYLTGRNLVLITKASIYGAQHGVSRVALGSLAGNPFPDARPEFLAAMGTAASLGLNHRLDVAAPFSHMHKEDVIRLGIELGVPLENTLSCMNPDADQRGSSGSSGAHPSTRRMSGIMHCGACSKCRERQDAFRAAGVPDPTTYRARIRT